MWVYATVVNVTCVRLLSSFIVKPMQNNMHGCSSILLV